MADRTGSKNVQEANATSRQGKRLLVRSKPHCRHRHQSTAVRCSQDLCSISLSMICSLHLSEKAPQTAVCADRLNERTDGRMVLPEVSRIFFPIGWGLIQPLNAQIFLMSAVVLIFQSLVEQTEC